MRSRVLVLSQSEEKASDVIKLAKKYTENIDFAMVCELDEALWAISSQSVDVLFMFESFLEKSAKFFEAIDSLAGIYTPRIMLIEERQRSDVAQLLEVGLDGFLQAPLEGEVLAAKIKAHLRIRNMAINIAKQKAELENYKKQTVQELKTVEHIYKNALKNPVHLSEHIDVYQQASATFSGDLFLVQPHPGGGLYALVGDFTGHGLASSVGLIPVARLFNELTAMGKSVPEIAGEINELIYTYLPVERFFAASILFINHTATKVTLWQGGISDTQIQRKVFNAIDSFRAPHMALGILSSDEFESECMSIDVELGDNIYLMSDGLSEAVYSESNGSGVIGDMLGEEMIKTWLSQNPDISTRQLVEKAKVELGRTEFDDDVTVVKIPITRLDERDRKRENTLLPLRIAVKLGPEELKQDECVELVLQTLDSYKGLQKIRVDLFTVLTELFCNALEHGILNLDSGLKNEANGFINYYKEREQRLAKLSDGFIEVKVIVQSDQNLIELSVEDSGKGFDTSAKSAREDDLTHGRGLQLLDSLCESIVYNQSGNCVKATLSLL